VVPHTRRPWGTSYPEQGTDRDPKP